MCNHHLTSIDADAPNKEIETIYEEVGIGVGKLRDRDEVFEGRDAHKLIEGCLECPRNTSQVQCGRLLVKAGRQGGMEPGIHSAKKVVDFNGKSGQRLDCNSGEMIDISDERDGDHCNHDQQEGRNIAPGRPISVIPDLSCDTGNVGGLENISGGCPNSWPQVAQETGSRGLIWTTLQGSSNQKDENVEEEAKRGDTEDNRCDCDTDLPKVTRECTTEKQQRDLQHHWQRLHDRVEVPCDNPVKLPLSALAAFDSRPSHVGRCITVEPLLPEHRQESGQQGGGETCNEVGLDIDHCGGWAGPSWEGGNIISESSIIDLVDEDAEEGGGLVA